MHIFAVITGDIIKSSKIREEERSHLLHELKTSLEKINEEFEVACALSETIVDQ